MAPSRNTVLALLSLVASIRALPAALPEPEAQIGLPHTYSISWDAPQPVTTDDPEEPQSPAPTPSDQISLGKPSATISWDGSPVPTDDPEPEDPGYPDDPEEPGLSQPSPTNIISLNPPSFSVSWDGPQPPKTTKKPWPPRPTKKTSTKGYVSATVSWNQAQGNAPSQPTNIISLNPPSYSISWDGPKPPKTTKKPQPPKPTKKTSTKGHVSATISWGKRQLIPSYSISWDGPQPPQPTKNPWPWWPPRPSPSAYTSTNGYVSASVSWGKRQEDEDPEPTEFPGFPEDPDFPEDPEEPGGPISFPSFPVPTPPNSIGIQPPSVSFSWGKRQEDEPEPTDFPEPEDPEDPADPIGSPVGPQPTPPNSIGIQPPHVSFSWGKREEAAAATPPPSIGLDKPTNSIKWPQPPKSTSKAWISWGKRQDDGDPTEVFPPAPTHSDQITFVPPTASISWGKRDAEAQAPTYGLGFPTFSFNFPGLPRSSAYISWGKRDDDAPEHHTTFLTHKTRPTATTIYTPTPVSSSCPTVTKTIVPPCVPPVCPHDLVSCKVGEAKELEEVKERQIEKTFVTITTVAKPTWKPTPTSEVCSAVTKTLYLGCPTYTCVPGTECGLRA
ncbi:hypothetical protein N0V90_013484 [Kalmusia sp. IMI 367209]|nr:hypothetical protein N0V90_013484 [Kalmusia sp. IMI 367209]